MIARPSVDRTLEAAVMKCIEPEPDNRLQDMGQFLSAIKRVKHEDGA